MNINQNNSSIMAWEQYSYIINQELEEIANKAIESYLSENIPKKNMSVFKNQFKDLNYRVLEQFEKYKIGKVTDVGIMTTEMLEKVQIDYSLFKKTTVNTLRNLKEIFDSTARQQANILNNHRLQNIPPHQNIVSQINDLQVGCPSMNVVRNLPIKIKKENKQITNTISLQQQNTSSLMQVRGLPNIGASCYLNSALQMIFHSNVKNLFTTKQSDLSIKFQNIENKIKHSSISPTDMNIFYQAMQHAGWGIPAGTAEDTAECFRFLVDLLIDEQFSVVIKENRSGSIIIDKILKVESNNHSIQEGIDEYFSNYTVQDCMRTVIYNNNSTDASPNIEGFVTINNFLYKAKVIAIHANGHYFTFIHSGYNLHGNDRWIKCDDAMVGDIISYQDLLNQLKITQNLHIRSIVYDLSE